jgi:urate oxidase
VIELGPNRYGKSAIHLVKVGRAGGRDRVRDLTVAVALEGDFAAAHVDGDNSRVIATDTMKNTVYALAADGLTGSIEDFGRLLAEHFLESGQVAMARISIDEHSWLPIEVDGTTSPDAFVRTATGTRTATVEGRRDGWSIEAGVRDLTVMKTTRSAFSGFPRDRYTTLAETEDRILATKIDATWRYGDGAGDYDALFEAVRATLLATFAEHHSPSVQASIWIIGKQLLETHPELTDVRMRLPNLHHWRADLTPFGITDEHDVYVATTEPHGLIEATVRRSQAG